MTEVRAEFSVEVDTVEHSRWDALLKDFIDANIYQTWAYGLAVKGSQELSHLLLKNDDEICAAAQVRIAKLPVIGSGIAYLRWGPLWRKDHTSEDLSTYAHVLRALRNEYSEKRGLVLRVLPGPFHAETAANVEILTQAKFTENRNYPAQRTILMDISPPLEELRRGLKQKWRNCLNHAEKNGLHVTEGESEELFDVFLDMYREMHDRKQFIETTDVRQFRIIQTNLPCELKMRIFLALRDGLPCAGALCSAMGKTGVYLCGATSNAGMNSKGAYLLQWRIVEWLREQGCTSYNLHGIDPIKNPGTYRFKSGLGGNYGREVELLGPFDAPGSMLSNYAVRCGDGLRVVRRRMKESQRRAGSNGRLQ